MEKMRFYLSFYFDNEECSNILNDYEEWFENEALQGKNEEEICTALSTPKKIVYNLYLENNQGPTQMQILFKNAMIQVLGLLILFFSLSILLLEMCNKNISSYLYFALGMVFLYFAAGMIMMKKDLPNDIDIDKSKFYRSNLIGLCFAIGIILSERHILPKMNYPNSGIICFYIISALILGLFFVNIHLAVKKILLAKQLAFLTTLHVSGIISLLLFTINQSHFMYNNVTEFSGLIYGSIGIYVETVLLCLIFGGTKNIKGNI